MLDLVSMSCQSSNDQGVTQDVTQGVTQGNVDKNRNSDEIMSHGGSREVKILNNINNMDKSPHFYV